MKRLMILLLAGAVSAAARGQTARQGDPSQVIEPTVFHSPMVIETIFAPALPALWKDEHWKPKNPKPWKSGEFFTTVEYFDLKKYSCDGLSINNGNTSGLVMRIEDKGAKTHIDIEAHITNPGYVRDKFVTLLFELVNGDEVVAKTMIQIKVKQNWRKKEEENGEHGKMVLDKASLNSMGSFKLRITMTTLDY